jgi:hypothetical protein
MSDNIRFRETGQASVLVRPWPLDLVITTHAPTRKTKYVFPATHNDWMICADHSTFPDLWLCSITSKDFARILCFVDRVSLYNLVNKTKLVDNFSYMFISILYMFRATMSPSSGEITVSMRHPSCIPDGHPHRVTNTRCHNDTVISPDDGHIVTRNL